VEPPPQSAYRVVCVTARTCRGHCLVVAVATLARPAPHAAAVQEWRFTSLEGVTLAGARGELVSYRGRHAVHLIPTEDRRGPTDAFTAILDNSEMTNGVIEADVAGAPRAGVPPDSRGFIGLAFRVQRDPAVYENLYLRPTNGRADDQLRRNHTVQYTSEPDFPWQRLRQEHPGEYESYADLEAGAWTAMKIRVSGRRAELFVNGAAQPCLIVNDLKLGDAHGRIALWAHSSTDAYFARVTVRRE